MFSDFLDFLVATGLCHHQINHSVLLMFMQFPSENGSTASNIANYMAGIRAQFITYNLDTTPFRHEQIQLFVKALKLDRPLQPKPTAIISTDLLKDILLMTQQSQFPIQFTALYSLAFFNLLAYFQRTTTFHCCFQPLKTVSPWRYYTHTPGGKRTSEMVENNTKQN